MKTTEVVEIDSWEEFQDIWFEPNCKYVLTSDICLEDKSVEIISDFYGVLEGNGHTIKNLKAKHRPIIRENNGIIKNLNIENFRIRYKKDVGGICMRNTSKIKNCHVSGDFKTKGNVGGIVAENLGDIENCSFEGKVESSRELRVGGIVAKNQTKSSIKECSASGEVRGYFRVGGIAAENSGTIESCNTDSYITENEEPNGSIGGIVGRNYGGLSASYFHGRLDNEYEYKGGLLAGGNSGAGSIINCHSKKIPSYSLIAENSGTSDNNSLRESVEEIQKVIIASKI